MSAGTRVEAAPLPSPVALPWLCGAHWLAAPVFLTSPARDELCT